MFGYPTSYTPISPISVNCEGRKDSKVTIQGTEVGLYTKRTGNAHWGNAIHSVSENPNVTFSVGVKAEAYHLSPLGAGRAFGVFGTAGNATSGWNYGIFGRLQENQNGAGIYGTITHDENGMDTRGRYAGFFNGPTKVVGDLYVTGSIYGVVLGGSVAENSALQAMSYSQSHSNEKNLNYADRLGKLDMISYYMPQTEPLKVNSLNSSGDTVVVERQLTAIELQCLEKRHFALSADQLQKDFPDLVYEREDGSKAVNYIEMIPILIQTIKELNNRISLLENSSVTTVQRSVMDNNGGNTRLYQNVPNPVIDFAMINVEIPRDVKQASLCFYDVNGVKVKTYNLAERGSFSFRVSASDFKYGLYMYALIIDGRVVETKRLIVNK